MRNLQGSYLGWQLDERRIEISGWTQASFTASSVNGNQLPLAFNYLGNNGTLQQNWLRIDRPVDTESTQTNMGFRSDWILPGSDYRFLLPRGLFNGQLTADDGQPNRYGIDPVQLYIETSLPRIGKGATLKVGRYFVPYGVETTEAITTPFASRTYTFVYNPFTQVGALATVPLTDSWSVVLGAAFGNDIVIDPANEPTIDLGVKWTSRSGRDSISVLAILGEGRFNVAENFNNINIVDLVYTHQFTSRLTYHANLLAGYQLDVPDSGDVNWQGVTNYLSYQLTPRVRTNGRVEYFNDSDGNRTGFAGGYTAVTAGLAIQPRASLIFRPEIRFDTNDTSSPFQGESQLVTAVADVIIRW